MKQNKGFVLILVLLILAVISWMSVMQWGQMLLYQRMIQSLIAQKNTLMTLEKLAQKFWQKNLQEPGLSSSGKVFFETKSVSYFIKQAGVFPCIQLKKGSEIFSTQHVIMTFFLDDNPNQKLVIRFAKPVTIKPCLLSGVRVIENELLSWEYQQDLTE